MKRPLALSASIAGFSALAVPIALTQPAMAQEEAEDALVQNTITVTVQKREENLRDVPVALTAIDETALADLGLDEFDQLARFVPGFEVQEQSPNNPGFVIRGLTSDSGEANIEPRIAVFQDGVSISRSRGSVVELFDLERVEVAKGPQPTLFGRGALIGGVNIIQAKPEFEFGGSATVGGGNLGEVFAEGHVTGPIAEDLLAFRVAGRLRQRDGYVESLNPNEEDFNSQDMAALRGSLAFTPTDTMRWDLIVNWQEDNPSGTSFKSGAFDPLPGASADPWEPANLNSFGGFLGGAKLGLERTVTSGTLLGDWEISDAITLTSITGIRDIDSVEVFDPDGFGLEVLIFAEDYQGEQFSQEFRASFDDGGPLTGFAGISYFDEEGAQGVPLTYDERAVQALLGGFLVPPNAPPIDALPPVNLNPLLPAPVPFKPIHNEVFTNFGETQTIDIFADASLDLTDRLELTGGIRWTQDDKTSALNVTLPEGPSNLTFGGIFVQPTLDANGAPTTIEASDTFDDVTYRLAGKFAVTDDVNVFANYSRGRRPEVITASAANPAAGFTTLDAETVDSFEIGLKGLFAGGDLSIDTSIFYYDYADFQTTIVNAETGLIEPITAGDATAEGAEAAISWTPIDLLAVTATYGYTKARFDDGEGQFPGNRLRLSPDNTASIAVRYLVDLPFGEMKIIPNYTWQSEVFFDNTERDLIS
ncbi:MAG: TonB-dependent receptor [Pseudomonadota bacterium]